MADTYKQLAKGTLGTANATLYTTPAATTTIVKSIILANKTATDRHATILLDGVEIVFQHDVPANDSIILSDINAILETGDPIMPINMIFMRNISYKIIS